MKYILFGGLIFWGFVFLLIKDDLKLREQNKNYRYILNSITISERNQAGIILK